jgi:hypothetical protein
MTIAQYIPPWLRSRLPKPAPQKIKILSKKDRQILPTIPNPNRASIRLQDDDSPPGYRILWRM